VCVQGDCGACFAFASALVFSVRLCHSTEAKTNIAISEQDLVSCHVEWDDFVNDVFDRLTRPVG
jgi:C1A family cysteine protease